MKYKYILVLIISIFSCAPRASACPVQYKYVAGLCIGGTQEVEDDEIIEIVNITDKLVNKFYVNVSNIENTFKKANIIVEFYTQKEVCDDKYYDKDLCVTYDGTNRHGRNIKVLLKETKCNNKLKDSPFVHELLHSIEWYYLDQIGWHNDDAHKTKYFFKDYYGKTSFEYLINKKLTCNF